MREVKDWISRAASSTATVLITGETGTGKEVVAQAIHRLGPHRDEPMLSINVAALPQAIVESELFGHERGAFTGADRRREGILRAAGTGTVFLDEIGDLDLAVQAKLLRVLEAREVLPVGAERTVPFRARVLAATHRDLAARVQAGAFREDLFYRLNILHIHLPPLRERPADIPQLAEALLRKIARRNGCTPPALSEQAMQALRHYPWPGNIRELGNVLERAFILADDGRIEVDGLPTDVRQSGDTPGLSLQEAVAGFERNHIAMVLRLCEGNRERCAKELGLSPATLYRRIERLGLKGYGVARPADAGQGRS
jgi:transcriptional regulator with PAS, ATPase and Fis domain